MLTQSPMAAHRQCMHGELLVFREDLPHRHALNETAVGDQTTERHPFRFIAQVPLSFYLR
jgi:hypothetical protein